jgi:uracil-DNA glycosylase
MSSTESERAALLASARAYLEWELELSGFGVPALAAGHAVSAASEAHVAPATGTRPITPPLASPPADPGEGPDVRATLVALPAGAPVADRRVRLTQLEEQVQGCTRCELAKGRTRPVFARGNPESPVVFVGEGPGQEEDRVGLPFVGPAGQLLDRMIAAMGYGRDDVYICNIVKCRPPGNRTPLPSEAGACSPFLLGQLEAVAPQVIVALGRCATENLGLSQGGGWRGRWGKFRGIDVMPTYHPAFLLRSPEFKRPVWEDLQKVMQRLKPAR